MRLSEMICIFCATLMLVGCSEMTTEGKRVSQAGDCAVCHDYPPLDVAHNTHISQGYHCLFCHPGFDSSGSYISKQYHLNETVDIVLKNPDGTESSAIYDEEKKTCSNVYCHGDFENGQMEIVSWGDTLDGCNVCHGTPPVTGAHNAHNLSMDCNTCHQGASIANGTAGDNHVNGIVDIDGEVGGGIYSKSTKACSAVYCHGSFSGGNNDTIGWAPSSLECSSCHAASPETGAHRAHLSSDCSICHSGYSLSAQSIDSEMHVNGMKDVATTISEGIFSAIDKTCSNISCHGNGSVGWYSQSSCNSCHGLPPSTGGHQSHIENDCNICHLAYSMTDSSTSATSHINGITDVDGPLEGGTYSPIDQSCSNVSCHYNLSARIWGSSLGCGECHSLSPLSGAHVKHNSAYDCKLCHAGYSIVDSSISDISHMNSTVEVDGDLQGGIYESSDSTCSSVYCHGNFIGGTNADVSWSVEITDCGACHAAPPETGAHRAHLSSDCSICHPGYSLSAQSIDSGKHVNGMKDVATTISEGTFSVADKTCSNISCHGNGSVGWYSQSSCNSCHGLPPSTGGHQSHIENDCNICHLAYSMTDSSTSATSHINGIPDVDGSLEGGTYSPIDQSCSNVSCHYNLSARIWGSSLGCGECHSLSPSSGAHVKHNSAYDCKLCHAGYSVVDSSISDISHMNSNVEVDGDLQGGLYENSDSTCSSVYCHGNFIGGTNADVNWSATITGCGACHAASPATGSHPTHSTENCSVCHAEYSVTAQSISPQNHINGVFDIDGNIGGAVYNNTSKTCLGGSCHSGGTRTWGVASGACTDCHVDPFASGSHTKHQSSGYECGECHQGYSLTNNQTSPESHKNGSVEVNGIIGGGIYNSSNNTCSSVYCHGDFPAGSNSTATWGSSPLECNSCHSIPSSGGAHQMHAVTYSYACAVCHAGYDEGAVNSQTHIDSVKNINGTLTEGKFNSADKSCSGIYCHGNFTGGNYTSVTWYNIEKLSCSTCHGTPPSTGRHTRHVNTRGLSCEECHLGYDLATQIVSIPIHANQSNDVVFKSGGSFDTSTLRCSNVSCHGDKTW